MAKEDNIIFYTKMVRASQGKIKSKTKRNLTMWNIAK